MNCSFEEILEVVEKNDKKRFLIQNIDNDLYIKATQGHSIEVFKRFLTKLQSLFCLFTNYRQLNDLALKPVKNIKELPSETVVHGTYMRCWLSIKKQGLCRMSRNHIHFALGEYDNKVVISGWISSNILFWLVFSTNYTNLSCLIEIWTGVRKDCEVLIYIDLDAALHDGIEFFISENNVVLTSGVNGFLAPKYFKYVLNARTKQPFDPDFPNAPPSGWDMLFSLKLHSHSCKDFDKLEWLIDSSVVGSHCNFFNPTLCWSHCVVSFCTTLRLSCKTEKLQQS